MYTYNTEKHPFAWPRFGVATVIFRACKHESIYAILSINTGQLNLDLEKQIKLVFLELDDKRFERKTWCIL